MANHGFPPIQYPQEILSAQEGILRRSREIYDKKKSTT